MMEKLKVLELFGGIGACSKALERLGIDYEIADYVEIDKYAVASFNAIHDTNFEPQDICTWNKDIDVDLIMHGSPCQDFSLAGKQAGGDKDSGTRSSLMYETLRIVEKLMPKYVIWENVKNLLSKKHRHNFDAYLEAMEKLGYTNFYQVLNAKDYGIPQNRERVFTVSIKNSGVSNFEFPSKQELKLKLKDMLENEVDEKYYLSGKQIESIKYSTFTINQRRIQEKDYCDTLCARDWKDPKCVQVATLPYFNYESDGRVYSPSGVSPCLRSKEPNQKIDENDTILIKNATKQGYLEATDGDGIDLAQPNSETRRGRVQKDSIQTITTKDNLGVVIDLKTKNKRIKQLVESSSLKENDTLFMDIYNQKTIDNESGTLKAGMDHQQGNIIYNDLRIRKLTPKECWRLMGFDDEDFEKAEKVNSNTQLYKQAGNSIVVNVLEAIFKNLLLKESKWSDLD